jgi:hypothetical protein
MMSYMLNAPSGIERTVIHDAESMEIGDAKGPSDFAFPEVRTSTLLYVETLES